MKNEPNPLQRYKQAMSDARKHLSEIEEAMREMEGHAIHGSIGWTGVGNAGRLRNELKEVADRLMGRGEYEKKG